MMKMFSSHLCGCDTFFSEAKPACGMDKPVTDFKGGCEAQHQSSPGTSGTSFTCSACCPL